jgi:outer membrane protein TolC
MKSRLELSAFLWTEDGGQYDLPEAVRPQGFKAANIAPLPELLQSAAVHPELVQYGYKLIDLRISRRLAFQSLLPDVKVKYNQMGYDFGKMAGNAWFNNNYRYGISLMVPLRLSEGRGEFQKAKLKIESTKLEQANKQVQLTTKLKQYYAQWQQTELQLSVQTGLVMNVAALQRGEETKFENGESSLFLVNARELKTIEAQQKEIELRSKVRKAEVDVRWAAGLLGR